MPRTLAGAAASERLELLEGRTYDPAVRVEPRGDFVEFPAEAIEQSISERFEQQVDRFSDRLAISTPREDLTYAELEHRANLIAHELLERRGACEEPVGILLGQGAPVIAAILGVLKAGKIYVPLDPFFPPVRLAHMLEWAEAGALITDSMHAELASSLSDGRGDALVVDRLSDGRDSSRPTLGVSPDAVVYVFFTSGSTGRPKGVYDSHRNILHNIRRYTNALTIGSEDRLTLLQASAFSGSVSSLFGALLNGAASFPFDLSREGPGRLAELIIRQRLTMYHSVPSVFRSFLVGSSRFPDLRVIRLEGDRASSRDVALYRRHFDPACVLANGLGTTETGLCRQYVIDHDVEVPDGILPVGYPVEGMEVEILAEDGRPVAAGASGEIAVRSRYLALGYWRRADLTDAAFHQSPTGEPERVYRTGDLGRLRPDGCLEYLTRKDAQPKIRGHRVDVGDTESELIALEGVSDAVVTVRESAESEAQLVAFVVSEETAFEPAELQRALEHTLPRHLIPTRFVRLETLPLDENGKVDRRALATMEQGGKREQTGAAPPSDSLERQLVEIWQDVLKARPIGVDESFVDLGGDSLAAVAVVARIESELGQRVTPDALAKGATVARLAAALRADGRRASSPRVALNPHGSLPPLFLVHDLNGEVLRYAELVHRLGPDQPVWGLRCVTEPDRIELMATRYLTELRRTQPTGPYRLGGWCFGAVVAFEMAHQLRANGEQVALLALIGISPWDFPRLVAPSARRRHQTHHGHRFRSRIARRIRRVRSVAPSTQTVLAKAREAFTQYVPAPYPGRALLVLSSDETATYSTDPESDWHGLCSDGSDVLVVPGGHDAVLAGPNARQVAEQLRRMLHRAGTVNTDRASV